MQIDHIFVFTDTPHAAAAELLAFGLTEGSSRVHPGQGTANRKFYFERFFLEILWVQNEAELASPDVFCTQLWQRARPFENAASPFGLCLVNTPDTDEIFAAALAYQPAYFPAGLSIDVLPHEHNRNLPWAFRLPFRDEKTASTEPTSHRAGLQRLTCATFVLACFNGSDTFLQQVADQTQLRFAPGSTNALKLEFDQHRQGKTKHFSHLNLTICY